jgi:hypothetical protein
MAFNKNQKIVVLHDNPPLPGKKFFLCSMISPESRQKNKVYGFKLHDMCEDEEDAKALQQYYHSLDNDFDILVGTVGKWCPWVFNTDDIANIQYPDQELTTLVGSHRTKQRSEDVQFKERIERHRDGIENATSVEAQKEIQSELKESCVQMLYRIKQIELVIKRRQDELASIQQVFSESYTQEERTNAENNEFPLTEPQLMYYDKLNDPNEINNAIESVDNSIGSSSSSNRVPKKTLAEIKQEILNKK